MSYHQQIQYVDYCKDGERFHNGGFVKAICDGTRQRIELHISCLDENIHGDYAIWMIPEKEKDKAFSTGNITIESGRGYFEVCREGGEKREDVTMKIYLGQGRVLETLLMECLLPPENQVKNTKEENTVKSRDTKETLKQEEQEVQEAQKTQKERENKKAKENPQKQEMQKVQITQEGQEVQEAQKTQKKGEEGGPSDIAEVSATECKEAKMQARNTKRTYVQCAETKWEQIEKIYPKKNTFGDHRNYIILKPEDFLLLRQDCYRLRKNSFLLHGYNNYGELVLWKEIVEGRECFYIGVPGIYDPRECQAAVYFGFERFECKQEPPEVGEKGYYLKRVSL